MSSKKNKRKKRTYPKNAAQIEKILRENLFSNGRNDLNGQKNGTYRAEGGLNDLGEYFENRLENPGRIWPGGLKSRNLADCGADSFTGEGAPLSAEIAEKLPSPPTNNMGVSKYTEGTINYQQGGYDSGLNLGFSGVWQKERFAELVVALERAKERAGSETPEEREQAIIELCGRTWEVQPTGAREGFCYSYALKGGGFRLLIHKSPEKIHQPVRVRFGAECLIGQDVYQVHADLIDWFCRIGFMVGLDENGDYDETIGRVDLQILIYRPVQEFAEAFEQNRVITRCKEISYHYYGGKVQTITLGKEIQLCIYDKREELMKSSYAGGD